MGNGQQKTPLPRLNLVNERGRPIDNRLYETTEQKIALEYVRPDDAVLELGARYGSVSVLTNWALRDRTKHAVVEPDLGVLPALARNRNVHGCKFLIVPGIVSSTNEPVYLQPRGYGSKIVPRASERTIPVKTFRLADLEKQLQCKFNCLLMDCEGGAVQFVKEHEWFMDQLDTVSIECDKLPMKSYQPVFDTLAEHGFVPVFRQNIYQVWQKVQRDEKLDA